MKLRIFPKMLICILAPAVIGLVVLALLATKLSVSAMREGMDTQLSELAIIQASEMGNLIESLHDLTKLASHLSDIVELADIANTGLRFTREDENIRSRVNAFFKSLSEDNPEISAALLVDTEGSIIAHIDPSRQGRDLSDAPTIISALGGQAAAATRLADYTGEYTAALTSPIMKGGKVIGSIMLHVNLNHLYNATAGRINFTESSAVYVVDKDANILMYEDLAHVGTNEAKYPYMQKILATKSGVIDYVFNGVAKVGYYAPIPKMGWVLVVSAQTNDLMQSFTEMTLNILFVAALIGIFVATIIFWIAKGIATSLRAGITYTTHVGAGNFSMPPEQEKELQGVLARGDEISDLAIGIHFMAGTMIKMIEKSEEKTEEAEKAVAKAEKATHAADVAAEEASRARKEGLLEAASQLESIVAGIASAADELSVQITQSSKGAEEQAIRIAEAATAMEEMNNTVLEVARNASESAEITDNTKNKASEGAEITQQCKEAIIAVREDSLLLRTNMGTLAGHAQSIDTVMGVISDIADQTNLLALNAAIEAARAGEAGRGFAVVADEVRKLAEKTIASTADVASAISAIQQSTEINVKQVDIAVTHIETATELAESSGETLAGIMDMANLSADGVRAIATASEEQSATSDEIANVIGDVNTISQDTANAMAEASKAVEELAKQTQDLALIVNNLQNS